MRGGVFGDARGRPYVEGGRSLSALALPMVPPLPPRGPSPGRGSFSLARTLDCAFVFAGGGKNDSRLAGTRVTVRYGAADGSVAARAWFLRARAAERERRVEDEYGSCPSPRASRLRGSSLVSGLSNLCPLPLLLGSGLSHLLSGLLDSPTSPSSGPRRSTPSAAASTTAMRALRAWSSGINNVSRR